MNDNSEAKKSVEAKVIEQIYNSENSQVGTLGNPVKVIITSGKHKGEILTANNLINNSLKEHTNVTKGNEVLLSIEENDDGSIKSATIYDFIRYKLIALVVFIFILLLSIIGGIKGIKSLLTLLLTGIAIKKIIIPIIIKGIDPIIPTILICIILIIINFILVSGINKKTLGAILGTTFGISISGILFLCIGAFLRITGINEEDAQILSSVIMGQSVNFRGIFFIGVLLSTLGAIMDIGITISSTMCELENNNPNISKKDLIKSGMNVGKDIMGTMLNTLILAYTGGALILLLVLSTYNMSFIEIINQDIVASEDLKALVEGTGIILTIPATVLIMAQFKNVVKVKKLFLKNID